MEEIQREKTVLKHNLSLNHRPPQSFRLRNPSLNTLRLRRIFDSFDENSDGEISLDELCRAMRRLGLHVETSELEEVVLPFFGPDGSGLDFEGFAGLHSAIGEGFFGGEEIHEEEEEGDLGVDDSDLTQAFKVFDENGDGLISSLELQRVLEKLGLREGEEIEGVKDMIRKVDRNHDDHVDFQEFKIMMQSVVVRSA